MDTKTEVATWSQAAEADELEEEELAGCSLECSANELASGQRAGGGQLVAQSKRKEKARIAARARRSQEATIIMDMAAELQITQDKLRRIDKATIVKLAIDYIRAHEVLCAQTREQQVELATARDDCKNPMIERKQQHQLEENKQEDHDDRRTLVLCSKCGDKAAAVDECQKERVTMGKIDANIGGEQDVSRNEPPSLCCPSAKSTENHKTEMIVKRINKERDENEEEARENCPEGAEVERGENEQEQQAHKHSLHSAPKLSTTSIFAPKTRDNSNSYFLMIEEKANGKSSLVLKPDTEILEDDDLTHLAPQAGDTSIAFETDPLDGIALDDLLIPSPPRDSLQAVLMDPTDDLSQLGWAAQSKSLYLDQSIGRPDDDEEDTQSDEDCPDPEMEAGHGYYSTAAYFGSAHHANQMMQDLRRRPQSVSKPIAFSRRVRAPIVAPSQKQRLMRQQQQYFHKVTATTPANQYHHRLLQHNYSSLINYYTNNNNNNNNHYRIHHNEQEQHQYRQQQLQQQQQNQQQQSRPNFQEANNIASSNIGHYPIYLSAQVSGSTSPPMKKLHTAALGALHSGGGLHENEQLSELRANSKQYRPLYREHQLSLRNHSNADHHRYQSFVQQQQQQQQQPILTGSFYGSRHIFTSLHHVGAVD